MLCIVESREIPDDLVPVRQLAIEAGLHINTLWGWIAEGRIRRFKRPGTGNITFASRAEFDSARRARQV